MNYILASRGSTLAVTQSTMIKHALEAIDPSITVELKIISTTGDRVQDRALSEIGGKGLFTKELEDALLDGSVDLAVHSMKDFPTAVPDGLCIGCIPEREDPRDIIISRRYKSLDEMPAGAKMGTSSLRRSAQLRKLKPDLEILPMRGNVDTRLRKLDNGEVDAIMLAAAGLNRLGLQENNSILLDTELMIPAVGQGALCIETSLQTRLPAELLAALHHQDTAVCVELERVVLHALEGSCQVPIATFAHVEDSLIHAVACVASLDGQQVLKAQISGQAEQAKELGQQLADNLLTQGARKILDAITNL